MMGSDFIVDVSEADFDYEVVAYSQETPVVVDFWAPWCAPCRVLSPLLEKLAEEAEGSFRLAKVNIEENPNLAKHYQVRNIPNVKAFHEGRILAEFAGVLPEPRLREFLQSIIPSEGDLILEKGLNLLESQQPQQAEETFRQALIEMPENPTAMLGLTKSLLLQGQGEEGLFLLQHFPASKEYNTAEILRPLAEALAHLKLDAPLEDDPLEAAYNRSLRLVKRGNIEAALDGLLDILRQNRRFRSGQPRQMILSLLELLGEANPLTRQYRSELASVLF